jgi:hypothetical protein
MKKALDVIDVTNRGRLTIVNDEGRKTVMSSPRIKPKPYMTLRKKEEYLSFKSNQTDQVEKVPAHPYIY